MDGFKLKKGGFYMKARKGKKAGVSRRVSVLSFGLGVLFFLSCFVVSGMNSTAMAAAGPIKIGFIAPATGNWAEWHGHGGRFQAVP